MIEQKPFQIYIPNVYKDHSNSWKYNRVRVHTYIFALLYDWAKTKKKKNACLPARLWTSKSDRSRRWWGWWGWRTRRRRNDDENGDDDEDASWRILTGVTLYDCSYSGAPQHIYIVFMRGIEGSAIDLPFLQGEFNQQIGWYANRRARRWRWVNNEMIDRSLVRIHRIDCKAHCDWVIEWEQVNWKLEMVQFIANNFGNLKYWLQSVVSLNVLIVYSSDHPQYWISKIHFKLP